MPLKETAEKNDGLYMPCFKKAFPERYEKRHEPYFEMLKERSRNLPEPSIPPPPPSISLEEWNALLTRLSAATGSGLAECGAAL
jgi:hypothetical protein